MRLIISPAYKKYLEEIEPRIFEISDSEDNKFRIINGQCTVVEIDDKRLIDKP